MARRPRQSQPRRGPADVDGERAGERGASPEVRSDLLALDAYDATLGRADFTGGDGGRPEDAFVTGSV